MQLLFAFTLINSVNGMCVGPDCCDATWYDNLPGCQAAQANGVCGGCEPFQINGKDTYCCHKHWNEEKEQKPAVAEQQVEVQTDSKADTMCEGAKCCDGKHSQWWSNKAGCLAQQTNGVCGGCEPFQINGKDTYCCHKHWNAEKEQKPAVAEQQVEVQTDSKADGMCVGPDCCDATWYDNLPGCQAAQANGVCGGCDPFQINGKNTYCCHKHWNEEKEQKPAVAEQQVEVQTDSKADGVCQGAACCDGKGTSWWDNKAGCMAQQTQGKCGGCEPFQINGKDTYCCHKHWNDSVLI